MTHLKSQLYRLGPTMWLSEVNWPNPRIPECTCSMSHNAPFWTEMCTFLFWMEHCGTWNSCILGFVKLVYWTLRNSFQWNFIWNSNISMQENAFQVVVCQTLVSLLKPQGLNSLWPSGAIWQHKSRLTLAQVVACCLTATRHYLKSMLKSVTLQDLCQFH